MEEQAIRGAVFVIAAAARVNARVAGMHAENLQRIQRDESIAYPESAFRDLIDEEGVGHNQVHSALFGQY